MYEEEIKQFREKELKEWKIKRLADLENGKEEYLETYEKQKEKIENAKRILTEGWYVCSSTGK